MSEQEKENDTVMVNQVTIDTKDAEFKGDDAKPSVDEENDTAMVNQVTKAEEDTKNAEFKEDDAQNDTAVVNQVTKAVEGTKDTGLKADDTKPSSSVSSGSDSSSSSDSSDDDDIKLDETEEQPQSREESKPPAETTTPAKVIDDGETVQSQKGINMELSSGSEDDSPKQDEEEQQKKKRFVKPKKNKAIDDSSSSSSSEGEAELFDSPKKRNRSSRVQRKPRGRRSGTDKPKDQQDPLYLPEPGTLEKVSKKTLTRQDIRCLPAWAFLVVIDESDPSTWHFPVRGMDGRINKSLLTEARTELASGQLHKRKALGFSLSREVQDRVDELVRTVWPGIPKVTLASCYTSRTNRVGNEHWIKESSTLREETNALMADIDLQTEDQDVLIARAEEEARRLAEERERERLEQQRIRIEQAAKLVSDLRAKRKLLCNQRATPLSTEALQAKIQAKTQQKKGKVKSRRNKRKGPAVTFRKVDQRQQLRCSLLKAGMNEIAEKRAIRNGYRDAKEYLRVHLKRREKLQKLYEAEEKRDEEETKEYLEQLQQEGNMEEEDNNVYDGDGDDDDDEVEVEADVVESSEKQEEKKQPRKPIKTYGKSKPREENIATKTLKALNIKSSLPKADEEDKAETTQLGDEEGEKKQQPAQDENELQEDGAAATEEKGQPNEQEDDNSKQEQDDESEQVDRAAAYKKILMAENKMLMKRRGASKSDFVEFEASEEESEDGVGDFGDGNMFRKKRSRSDELEKALDSAANRLTEKDLEGIVDHMSDDEGKDGGDIGDLHRKQEREREDAELEKLQDDIRNHKLIGAAARRRRKIGSSRMEGALGEDSEDEETDEEEEMAKQERYRASHEQRREEAQTITNKESAAQVIEEIDEEADQLAQFLRLAKLEKARRKMLRKKQRRLQQEQQDEMDRDAPGLTRSTSLTVPSLTRSTSINATALIRSGSLGAKPPLKRSISLNSNGGSRRKTSSTSFVRTLSKARKADVTSKITEFKPDTIATRVTFSSLNRKPGAKTSRSSSMKEQVEAV